MCANTLLICNHSAAPGGRPQGANLAQARQKKPLVVLVSSSSQSHFFLTTIPDRDAGHRDDPVAIFVSRSLQRDAGIREQPSGLDVDPAVAIREDGFDGFKVDVVPASGTPSCT